MYFRRHLDLVAHANYLTKWMGHLKGQQRVTHQHQSMSSQTVRHRSPHPKGYRKGQGKRLQHKKMLEKVNKISESLSSSISNKINRTRYQSREQVMTQRVKKKKTYRNQSQRASMTYIIRQIRSNNSIWSNTQP